MESVSHTHTYFFINFVLKNSVYIKGGRFEFSKFSKKKGGGGSEFSH